MGNNTHKKIIIKDLPRIEGDQNAGLGSNNGFDSCAVTKYSTEQDSGKTSDLTVKPKL